MLHVKMEIAMASPDAKPREKGPPKIPRINRYQFSAHHRRRELFTADEIDLNNLRHGFFGERTQNSNPA